METTKKAWINGLFFVITLIINAIGAQGIINGLAQKDVSDMIITLLTPSPATFSIWGVIYLLLLISVIVMIAKKDMYYKSAVNQISTLFRISCILNFTWIIAFSYVQIELSALLISGFAIVLAMICQELLKINDGGHWLLPLSFGIYAGWLFIAAVINIVSMLDWNGFIIVNNICAIIILIAAIIPIIVILLKIKNASFPLPVAWAYFGIYQSLNISEEFSLLQNITLAGVVVLAALAVFQFYRNRFSLMPKSEKNQ